MNGRFTEPIMTSAMRTLARQHHLDTADYQLLQLTNNAVFALPRSNVVIRIARSHQAAVRVQKGVDLARWFQAIDAPTIRLARLDRQPVVIDGFHATVWKYLAPIEPTPTPADLGQTLKRFHGLGLPPFPLPPWGPVDDARRRLLEAEALDDADRAALDHWCDDLAPRIDELKSRQPDTLVHGDAHVGNLLRDNHRIVLCDFDAICAGPWQADLVAVAVGEDRFGRRGAHEQLAASYGYDVRQDPQWALLRQARELKMIVAAVPLLASGPGVAEEFQLRLRSIRDGDTSARWTPFARLRPS